MQQQSALLAYVDVFRWTAVLAFFCAAAVWLFSKPPKARRTPARRALIPGRNLLRRETPHLNSWINLASAGAGLIHYRGRGVGVFAISPTSLAAKENRTGSRPGPCSRFHSIYRRTPMPSPSKDLKETESALLSVIHALIDGQEGFKKIGEEIKDEALKEYFLAESLTRAQFRGVLESILHQEGVHDIKGERHRYRNRSPCMGRFEISPGRRRPHPALDRRRGRGRSRGSVFEGDGSLFAAARAPGAHYPGRAHRKIARVHQGRSRHKKVAALLLLTRCARFRAHPLLRARILNSTTQRGQVFAVPNRAPSPLRIETGGSSGL